MEFVFSRTALREFERMPEAVQRRIIEKLRFFVSTEQPLRNSKHLVDSAFGTWRFRVGDYRLICDVADERIIILKVGNRKNIYR